MIAGGVDLCAAGMLAAGLYLVYVAADRATDEPIAPGSGAEIEAKLATIEELG